MNVAVSLLCRRRRWAARCTGASAGFGVAVLRRRRRGGGGEGGGEVMKKMTVLLAKAIVTGSGHHQRAVARVQVVVEVMGC